MDDGNDLALATSLLLVLKHQDQRRPVNSVPIHLQGHKETSLITSSASEEGARWDPEGLGQGTDAPSTSKLHPFHLLHFYHCTYNWVLTKRGFPLSPVWLCWVTCASHVPSLGNRDIHLPWMYISKRKMVPSYEIKTNLSIFISVTNINRCLLRRTQQNRLGVIYFFHIGLGLHGIQNFGARTNFSQLSKKDQTQLSFILFSTCMVQRQNNTILQ